MNNRIIFHAVLAVIWAVLGGGFILAGLNYHLNDPLLVAVVVVGTVTFLAAFHDKKIPFLSNPALAWMAAYYPMAAGVRDAADLGLVLSFVFALVHFAIYMAWDSFTFEDLTEDKKPTGVWKQEETPETGKVFGEEMPGHILRKFDQPKRLPLIVGFSGNKTNKNNKR